jgi:serine/threonine protein kinase
MQRVQIAAGTAKGLAELHSQGIIHRDVKSTNILLDAASSPLVADMGLCRVLAPAATHTTTRRMGTDGYIDPEYSETLELREQSDVYSFGVVLLELVSNQAAYTEGMNPPGLVGRFRQHLRAGKPLSSFGDPRCGWAQWMVTDLGAVAEQCLKLPGSLRPKMRDVARMLDRISLMARTAELEARAGGVKQPLAHQEQAIAGAARPQPQPQQQQPQQQIQIQQAQQQQQHLQKPAGSKSTIQIFRSTQSK